LSNQLSQSITGCFSCQNQEIMKIKQIKVQTIKIQEIMQIKPIKVQTSITQLSLSCDQTH
ncbi:MAG: hypothetical protein K1X92_18290, partial [Bacteroidia bacterium]|nr:hypothetical protein [Bacteroidia bacterium]